MSTEAAPDPNFTVRHDLYHHTGAEAEILAALQRLESILMSDLTPRLDRLEQAVTGMEARLAEDVAELQRRVAAGQATPEEEARLAALVDRIANINPLPDFPEAAPDAEQTPGDGTDTEPPTA